MNNAEKFRAQATQWRDNSDADAVQALRELAANTTGRYRRTYLKRAEKLEKDLGY